MSDDSQALFPLRARRHSTSIFTMEAGLVLVGCDWGFWADTWSLVETGCTCEESDLRGWKKLILEDTAAGANDVLLNWDGLGMPVGAQVVSRLF